MIRSLTGLVGLLWAGAAFAASSPVTVTFVSAGGVTNSITITNQSGADIPNYPFQFGRPFVDGAIPHAPQVLVNGVAQPTQADIKNRYPDGSVEFSVVSVVVPDIPATGAVTLAFADTTTNSNTPLTAAQMLDPSYNFDMAATFTPTATTFSGDAMSARTMLANGDYKLWASGPVAQTIILADDTTARKYDIGFGDGFHPLRPRFYATFWPATHQVFVRAVVESSNIQELENTSYAVSLSAGETAPSVVYTAALNGSKIHWEGSSWDRSFWLNGTPPAQVNIDNNLAYLESTRFIPNFDTQAAVSPNAAAIATEYALWTGKPHDIYDGVWDGGFLTSDQGATGDFQQIGPMPSSVVMWLYTGDWRMRQMALGLADLAPAWPYHMRETNPAKIFMRDGAAGVGLGLPFSIAGRPTFRPNVLTWTSMAPIDAPTIVGPLGGNPWTYADASHEPHPFFGPYILTGDAFYHDEDYAWSAYSIGTDIPGFNERGPDGSYAGLYDQVRGSAWGLLGRAESAFAAPDGSLEKAYLTPTVNDALARWEGTFGITGTPLTGSTMQVWGAANPVAAAAYLWTPAVPFHEWENNIYPAEIAIDVAAGEMISGAASSYGDPWMMWYLQYALGRTREIGFAAGAVQAYNGKYMMDLLNSANPMGVAIYEEPVSNAAGVLFTSWDQVFAAMPAAYLNGTQAGGGLPAYFAQNQAGRGRMTWGTPGLAMLADAGYPGAAAAWSGWWNTNVYQPAIVAPITTFSAPFSSDPSWAIVPRTDSNVLPAQPTAE